jgi:iron complex transport system substrate-binding protein
MKRLLFFFLMITLLLAGCTPAATVTAVPSAAPTAAAISLKDGMNRPVTLAAPAKKIISMAPSNTEILFALGAGPLTIGRDEFSDTPAEAKSLPSVGGSMGKYNYEQIAKLQPDLVLASSLNTADQVKALEDLKLTVFVLANPTTLDGMYANLATVGTLTGRSADAQKLTTSLQARQKKVMDIMAANKAAPKVFYELDASDPAKLFTTGANTFISVLIKMAGGANIGDNLKGDYPQISSEELVAQNPEIVLLGDGAYGVTAEQVAKRPGWANLAAVKTNKIFVFDDNLVSRPGPRLIEGLETLAKLIHPELFK